jgi:hypothetical protein
MHLLDLVKPSRNSYQLVAYKDGIRRATKAIGFVYPTSILGLPTKHTS